MTARIINIAIFTMLYLGFLVWYDGWGSQPMTSAEAEGYLAELSSDLAGEDFVESMRELAAQDDGNEIFMLNLNRYQYAEGEAPVGIPAAYQAYGDAVVGMILRNAGHPIYSGAVAGLFQSDDSESRQWDEVILVRYRSRRDFLSMISSQPFQQAAGIRAGGIAYAEVTPNTPGINLSTPRLIIFIALLLPGLLIDRLLRSKI